MAMAWSKFEIQVQDDFSENQNNEDQTPFSDNHNQNTGTAGKSPNPRSIHNKYIFKEIIRNL